MHCMISRKEQAVWCEQKCNQIISLEYLPKFIRKGCKYMGKFNNLIFHILLLCQFSMHISLCLPDVRLPCPTTGAGTGMPAQAKIPSHDTLLSSSKILPAAYLQSGQEGMLRESCVIFKPQNNVQGIRMFFDDFMFQ